jgi:hypothetical protein
VVRRAISCGCVRIICWKFLRFTAISWQSSYATAPAALGFDSKRAISPKISPVFNTASNISLFSVIFTILTDPF